MIRPFEPRDYEPIARIGYVIDPDSARGADWLRARDETFDPKLLRVRVVAERDGQVVGWGQVGHRWWAYHPRKFNMRIEVEPAWQRTGIGSALYAKLAETLATWDPLLVEAGTREGRRHAIEFLERRGYSEQRRRWQSRVALDEVNLDSLRGARQRLERQGIAVTTMSAERDRRGDDLLHDVFQLELRAMTTEPGFEPDTSMPFEQFLQNELLCAESIPEAAFLALDGERVVGISRLQRTARPDVLDQGFTGVDPDYRGRGIALALKVCTIDYARANGFSAIATQNDTTNEPMLHINDRLGFHREPAWIVFERHFPT